MKLLLTDCGTVQSNNDISLEVLEQFGSMVCYDNIGRDELLKVVGDFDIILCNKTIIDREVMTAAKNLKYIGLFATGFNNIDITAAKDFGITVCNAGSYSTDAVAQQVFAYILNHFSSVNRYDALVKSRGWINSPTFSMLCCPTDEIAGKTIGIVGYGSIGRQVERISKAFNMIPIVYTRTVRDNDAEYVSFDELLRRSNIVTAHCPLNDQSRELFSAEVFAKMKDGAYFINTARGGVVNEQALFDALESGKLCGAAVDVLSVEPMSEDCVLLNAKNIVITPHTSWAPLTTRQRLVGIVTDNIKAFLNGNPTNKIV